MKKNFRRVSMVLLANLLLPLSPVNVSAMDSVDLLAAVTNLSKNESSQDKFPIYGINDEMWNISCWGYRFSTAAKMLNKQFEACNKPKQLRNLMCNVEMCALALTLRTLGDKDISTKRDIKRWAEQASNGEFNAQMLLAIWLGHQFWDISFARLPRKFRAFAGKVLSCAVKSEVLGTVDMDNINIRHLTDKTFRSYFTNDELESLYQRAFRRGIIKRVDLETCPGYSSKK